MVDIQEIAALMRKAGLALDESVTLPGRPASFAAVPESIHPALKVQLGLTFPKGLYTHQARSIHLAAGGQDVCVATPTASGKSLVFMSVAAHLVLNNEAARVLAIYPAKALIQDQLTHWEEFLQPFNIRVGFIDGSVPMQSRGAILRSCRVVAITPDVAHAWLMSHLADTEVTVFLRRLALVILDEAHVYDGAFGTNMGYFLRRLGAAVNTFRLVSSTATIGEPVDFMRQLTGRECVVLGPDDDGSAVFEKALLLSRVSRKHSFDLAVRILLGLAHYGRARFLAFGDSRKAVERIVAAVLRDQAPDDEAIDDSEEDETEVSPDEVAPEPATHLEHVLPYRAGYEADDRRAIQLALTKGTLAGVVSTSALELGIDIGDLDIVVLLNTPSNMKSFHQRIGRAGRRRPAVCIVLDDQGTMTPLAAYLKRPVEPSWLYLENRYIQYANALCAAAELQTSGLASSTGISYPGLPKRFAQLVENELNPTEAVPPDLYSLKQRSQANPHYEFPIRSAAEPNFTVEGPFGRPLGSLSFGQALREAYPGAVYYYMAKPYRAFALDYKKGLIRAKKCKHFTTKPQSLINAFPDFKSGVLRAWRSEAGFVCEVELQVSERVGGFIEQRGPNRFLHEYGPLSPYSQKPLTRFFRTTGICWAFPEIVERNEITARHLLEAFSMTCGIQERDLGLALFRANQGPFEPTPVSGSVIFDATNGSLRLTERLGEQFTEVIGIAIDFADDEGTRDNLLRLRDEAGHLTPQLLGPAAGPVGPDDGWVQVIGRQQPAIYLHAEGPLEVVVRDFRYTPQGIMYDLEPLQSGGAGVLEENGAAAMKWLVSASHLQPVHGRTELVRYHLVTGEEAAVTG